MAPSLHQSDMKCSLSVHTLLNRCIVVFNNVECDKMLEVGCFVPVGRVCRLVLAMFQSCRPILYQTRGIVFPSPRKNRLGRLSPRPVEILYEAEGNDYLDPEFKQLEESGESVLREEHIYS